MPMAFAWGTSCALSIVEKLTSGRASCLYIKSGFVVVLDNAICVGCKLARFSLDTLTVPPWSIFPISSIAGNKVPGTYSASLVAML